MAVATAKRVNHFLDLPVAIVTDQESLPANPDYKFDQVIIADADKTNVKNRNIWANKGRYRAYQFSPYDETILLDTDYLVNSRTLLKTFETYDDFCCHNTTTCLMAPGTGHEIISSTSFHMLWATVITFRKTKRAEQIFDCMKMIQENYQHYSSLYGFVGGVFRNDYALSIALRIVNGHTVNKQDYIPWKLVHVDINAHPFRESDDEFNTAYTVMYDNWQRGKIRKDYINIVDTDFHVLDKDKFTELTK
ncbi:MAG: hypothetical protein WCR20_11630 [Verrucomicrobiota bacterium]